MSDFEQRLRGELQRMGEDPDPSRSPPAAVLRRAARLSTVMLTAYSVAMLVIAGGAAIGIRTWLRAEPVPVAKPTNSVSPTPTQLRPGRGKISAIAFVGSGRGWIAIPSEILTTADGGKSWGTETRLRGVVQLDFLDAGYGWALTSHGLFRTINGGQTWQRAGDAPNGKSISSVRFVSPAVGWGLSGSRLLRSVDGGTTWEVVRSDVSSICPVDGSVVYASSGTRILMSADGGTSWTTFFNLTAPSTRLTGSDIGCAGRQVWAAYTGGVAAGSEAYVILRPSMPVFGSPLVGSTKPFEGLPTLGSYVGAFDVISPDDAVFTGFCSACFPGRTTVEVTHDGGRTWAKTVVPVFQPQQLSFADPAHGWMLASVFRGARLTWLVLATSDGGVHWSRIYPG